MQSSKFLVIVSFFSIYVIWGSTYLFNKIAVSEISAFFLALLFLVLGNGLFVWALKYVDSGFGALMASTQPLFVLFLLRLIDGKKLQTKSIIGVLLGIVGMILLITQKEIATSEGSLLGIFMMLCAILCWSYGSVFVSKADLPKNFFVSTGYQMIFASLILLVVSFSFGEVISLPTEWSFKVQGSVMFLILFGSIVAFTAFNYLLKVVSPEKVATSAYINPIIAMVLGWYVLDENLSTQSVIASFILLLGVYFINARKRVTKKVTTKPQKV